MGSQVGGKVSDALQDAGVPGLDGRNIFNAWGRVGLETAGNAVIAAVTGGNAGSAALSTAAGDDASIASRDWAYSVAKTFTSDKVDQKLIANALSNIIASGAGAIGGAISGKSGSSGINALNGAAAASAIQQFNQANENDEKEGGRGPRNLREALDWVFGSSSAEITEEFREQTYDANASELAKLDPSNPELQTLTAPGQPRVLTDDDVSRMEQALSDAREVNRLLTTPEGKQELLEKAPVGTENLRDAAKNLIKSERATDVGAKAAGNATSHAAGDIRFSQNTVSFNKTDRGNGAKFTYDDLVQSMRTSGWKGDPVDVVKMPDGKLTSIDNTRIAAAREAGIDVKATVRGFEDPLTPAVQEARGWQQYSTWGEAIMGRINKQSGGFSSSNAYGASEVPRITGSKK